MKAYPVPVRLALLAAVDRGMSKREAAHVFGVSLATVNRYAVQRRTTGSLAPRPSPAGPRGYAPTRGSGRRPLIPPEDHPALLAMVLAHPSASQEAYCHRWQERGGKPVSTSTMSRTLHRLGCVRRPRPGGRP